MVVGGRINARCVLEIIRDHWLGFTPHDVFGQYRRLFDGVRDNKTPLQLEVLDAIDGCFPLGHRTADARARLMGNLYTHLCDAAHNLSDVTIDLQRVSQNDGYRCLVRQMAQLLNVPVIG